MLPERNVAGDSVTPEGLGSLEARLRRLEDRIAVQDRIWAALIFSDLGEWAKATACYAADATVDLVGYDASIWPDPTGMPVDEFRRLASAFMPGFSIRQHQVTNFNIVVADDRAISNSQVRAIHVIDGEVWEAHAAYRHSLRRTDDDWRIEHLHATLIHQSAAHLVDVARRKVTAAAA